jgi:hypothetical protein
MHKAELLAMLISQTEPSIDPRTKPIFVNDTQSRLNHTRMDRIVHAESLPEVQQLVECAGALKKSISICGKRHSMGGQQFLTGQNPARHVKTLSRTQFRCHRRHH